MNVGRIEKKLSVFRYMIPRAGGVFDVVIKFVLMTFYICCLFNERRKLIHFI